MPGHVHALSEGGWLEELIGSVCCLLQKITYRAPLGFRGHSNAQIVVPPTAHLFRLNILIQWQ